MQDSQNPIYAPQPLNVPPQVPPVPPTVPPTTPPQFTTLEEKRGFLSKINPKIVGIIFGVLVLLGLAGFLVNKFFLGEEVLTKETTITYWGLWEDVNSLSTLISTYEAQNPGVKINYVRQAKEDYRERLVSAMAKGEGPDIFRFHNTWVPMMSGNLSGIPADVYNYETFQATFYPVAVSDLQRGSELVGIPLMFDGLGLYINEAIFLSGGKEPPKTWDELRRIATDLTVRDANGAIVQAGVAIGRVENVDHWQDILSLLMLQNGANLNEPTGKLAEGALDYFIGYSTLDRVWDETMPGSTQAFAGGKLAMFFGPSWRAFEIKQQNPNLAFKVVPVPQVAKNIPTDPDISWASYWAEGVSSKSNANEASWKFLKYLSQKESLEKLYSNAAASRLFGPVYPRVDMASLVSQDPIVGAYVTQAPYAKSWYLTSRTFDGPTGINSRISKYFEDAINGIILERKTATEVLATVAQGVSQVLSSYSKP